MIKKKQILSLLLMTCVIVPSIGLADQAAFDIFKKDIARGVVIGSGGDCKFQTKQILNSEVILNYGFPFLVNSVPSFLFLKRFIEESNRELLVYQTIGYRLEVSYDNIGVDEIREYVNGIKTNECLFGDI